jgi:hypothetical protein
VAERCRVVGLSGVDKEKTAVPLAQFHDGRPLGAAVDWHESFELAADELFLALVELDLGLRLRCLVR